MYQGEASNAEAILFLWCDTAKKKKEDLDFQELIKVFLLL